MESSIAEFLSTFLPGHETALELDEAWHTSLPRRSSGKSRGDGNAERDSNGSKGHDDAVFVHPQDDTPSPHP